MCNYPFYVKKDGHDPVMVPCGQCTQCRLEKARQWAVRICHEAQLYEDNCFITLTYNTDSLPRDGVRKRDLQLFFKRLRRRIEPLKIRYYGVGEYGDNFSRPHYHAIIFNYDFPDKELWEYSKGKFGTTCPLYRSPLLEDIWQKGYSRVGECSFESAGYVARYVMKKINGYVAPYYYDGRTPEFALMSRRPGIGRGWYEKFKGDVFPKDYFQVNGHRQRPSRYYDDLLKKEKPELYEQIKELRKEKQKTEDPVRRVQKEKYKSAVSKNLIRRLHNDFVRKD